MGGPFNELFDIKRVVDADGTYKGTTYSNAQYLLNKLMDDRKWSVLGHTSLSEELNLWIADKRNPIHPAPLQCNSDIMMQQNKGIIGIRIDNVRNIKIDGFINIERLHNLGEFGETVCGKYYDSNNGGHKHQIYPLQIGYTGNEVHGIAFYGDSQGVIMQNASIKINNLLSARSNVFGIQFHSESNIQIEDNVNININNIHAGAYLSGKDTLTLKTQIIPNTVPRVCLFDIWQNAAVQFVGDNINIQSECVTSYTSCSFGYWQIDQKYNYDDVLNVEYITNVNNKNCAFDVEKENVLTTLSKTSKYHSRSLDLLRSQSLNKEIEVHQDTVSGHYLSYFGLCVAAFLIPIIIVLFIKHNKNINKDEQRSNVTEQSPLLI